MIRPIIIAEYHQTKNHFLKVVIVICILTLLLRLAGGSLGFWILLVGVYPNLGLVMGHGTFAEEFMKGQFKFLFSLPVSRLQIWLVKCVSGLIGLMVLCGIVSVIMFSFPGEELRKLFDFLPTLEVSPRSLAALIAGVCLYGFGVGFFSITACTSTKVAGVVSSLLLYFPLVVFWIIHRVFSWDVPLAAVSFMFMTAAASFIVGALVVFGMRNPFVDSAWMRRLTGLSVIVITGAVMAATAGLALSWDVSSGPPTFDNVIQALPSPDGRHIMVISRKRLIQSQGHIVTVDGKIIHDLGTGASALGTEDIAWRPTSNGFEACYIVSEAISSSLVGATADQDDTKINVLSLESGVVTEMPNLQEWEEKSSLQYIGWMPDGQQLIGIKRRHLRQESYVQIVAQDFGASDISTIGAEFESHDATLLPSGNVKVRTWDRNSEQSHITLIDPRSGESQSISTDEDETLVGVSPDAQELYLIGQIYEGQSVGSEVLAQSVSTQQKRILVSREELPTATLQEAARGRVGGVYATVTPAGKWLQCTVFDGLKDSDNTNWMVALPSADRIVMPMAPEGKNLGESILSPNETRVFRQLHVDTTSEEIEDIQEALSKTDIEVLELGTIATTRVYKSKDLENAYSFKWLNEDTIIFSMSLEDTNTIAPKVQLWKIDLKTGSCARIMPENSEQN